MNLLELRQHIRQVSGRFDLVDEDGRDLGIDVHINNGSRYLDKKSQVTQSYATKYFLGQTGEFLFKMEDLRALKSVWAATETERWELSQVSFLGLRERYSTGVKQVTGQPMYYTPAILRNVPADLSEQDLTSLDWVVKYMEVMTTNSSAYNGLLVAPRLDRAYMIEVVGLFYNPKLVDNTDENFWSVQHPELLTMATLLQLEIVQRNSQGVKDWQYALQDHLVEVNMDLVENTSDEVDQIGG
jgi:hypothetical protein